jgi:hypothetical protein
MKLYTFVVHYLQMCMKEISYAGADLEGACGALSSSTSNFFMNG